VLEEAEKCGVDVSGYRAIAEGLQEQLAAIKKGFHPPMKIGDV
jgi:hypothetical protein